MTINKEHMELWIQALESDKHQQCTGTLRQPAQEQEYVVTFSATGPQRVFPATPEMHCAQGIGVLVALLNGVEEYDEFGDSVWDIDSDLPRPVMDFYGLESSSPRVTIEDTEASIIMHNDEYKYSFWTIAQAMRAEFLKDGNDA